MPPDEEDDGLATSEDLFGHLVDAPPPPGTGTKSTRSAPVRVRVSDPVSPEPLTPVEPEAVEPPHAPVLEEAPFRRMRPAAPVDDDEQARRPPAHENTGAKFIITPPKIALGPGVDLAATWANNASRLAISRSLPTNVLRVRSPRLTIGERLGRVPVTRYGITASVFPLTCNGGKASSRT